MIASKHSEVVDLHKIVLQGAALTKQSCGPADRLKAQKSVG